MELFDRVRVDGAGVTVGELARWLSTFDPSTEVIVEFDAMRYFALQGFNGPCGTEDRAQQAVCLITSEEM
jgi:hypothetical protein